MNRIVLIFLLAGATFAQQSQSLGDIARANRAKKGNPSTAGRDASKDDKQDPAKPKRKVFTNEDIASPPEPTATTTASKTGSAPPPQRRLKPGLSLRQVTQFHDQIAVHRGMIIALEREAKPLRDRKDLTTDEETKLFNLDLRIGFQKKAIADIEDKLYQ